MNNLIRFTLLLFLSCILVSCQSSSINQDHSAVKIEPQLVNIDHDINKKYLWGGEILEITNFKDTTELVIISYPLNRSEKPTLSEPSTGRFIATYPGFLEPTDHNKGKLITLTGNLKSIREGQIENADYNFPVVSIDQFKVFQKKPNQIHLPFSVGIGIGL